MGPQLPPITCDSGRIAFLQVVGITDEELLQCESGEPYEMEAALRKQAPSCPMAATGVHGAAGVAFRAV